MVFSQIDVPHGTPRISHVCDTPSSESLHIGGDVGRESCHKDKGGGVFYYLPLDRSFFAVCVAFLAQGIFDGHTTPIADVAVPH